MITSSVPLLGITAFSGTGKTTLLKNIIPILSAKGIRCALIKHSHHDMDIDTPGKDSYELRRAGATQTIVACDQRWALMTETPENVVDLISLANKFDKSQTDIIFVEGFKHEPIDKIALYRETVGKPLEALIDEHVVALASDVDVKIPSFIHKLNINNTPAIVEFILYWLKRKNCFKS